MPGTTPVEDRQLLVDLGAITGNVAALCELVRGSQVMAVVKADGYGHGMVPAAWAALAGGAGWLGVADLAEAVALRQAGFSVPVLCLMAFGGPGSTWCASAGPATACPPCPAARRRGCARR